MHKLLIFTPLALENGRGGEISAMELAAGLHPYYDITLLDTNIVIGKEILTNESINHKLHGLKRSGRIRFAIFRIFDKTIPIIQIIKKCIETFNIPSIKYVLTSNSC